MARAVSGESVLAWDWSLPVVASQFFQVPSSLAVMSDLPAGVNTSAVMCRSCARIVNGCASAIVIRATSQIPILSNHGMRHFFVTRLGNQFFQRTMLIKILEARIGD